MTSMRRPHGDRLGRDSSHDAESRNQRVISEDRGRTRRRPHRHQLGAETRNRSRSSRRTPTGMTHQDNSDCNRSCKGWGYEDESTSPDRRRRSRACSTESSLDRRRCEVKLVSVDRKQSYHEKLRSFGSHYTDQFSPRATEGYCSPRHHKSVLFLMGLPGAGKSTVKRRRMRPGDVDIEPDRFKRRHRRYSTDMGEETDDEVHRWSVRHAVGVFEDALSDPRPRDIVFDSSGSNASWMKRRIETAKKAGFVTELLWVDVPQEIAILRNRNRGFLNGRTGQFCPEQVIIDKAKVLPESFEELRHCVDFAEQLPNWSESSGELESAKEDLYLYPAPRNRPPPLRPGCASYGEGPDGARSPSLSAGSRRILRIGPWKRSDETTRRKNARLSWMDRTFKGDRERFVSEHVLGSRDVLLERNRYPYELPPDCEHWTIWNRKEMKHKELCEYVEAWLDAREPHNAIAWNYDDNRGRRTIDIWHVHIYFQGRDGNRPTLPCPFAVRADSKERDGHKRCQRGLSTATTKAPSSPSEKRSPSSVRA